MTSKLSPRRSTALGGFDKDVVKDKSKKARLPSFFEVHAIGQLDTAEFPGCDNLYCKYWFNYGQDWIVAQGLEDGLTQISTIRGGGNDTLVWNFPIDIAFKSTNSFGWPQIGLAVYGHDSMGRDVITGYGAVHIPTAPGTYTLKVRTFRPLSSSLLQQFLGWMNGNPPEYVDVKRASKAQGRDVTRVKSHGVVNIKLNVVMRNMEAFGYSEAGRVQMSTNASS
mmetsp:Transcript_18311/g.43056  ORF Transcript_18311/g.43056 Transcript_18311/m.43056 type:complete len:223 (+) Transcript_18311:102-770(+)